jgi:beta-lactamase class A
VTLLHLLLAASLGAPGGAAQQPAQPARLEDARSRIDAAVAASGADVAVAWRPLDADESSSDRLLINAHTSFHAASTMKVPVMIELFRQAAAGRLRLDDTMPVINRFHSLADGSEYTLSVGDDSDAEMYRAVGQTMTLRGLCEAMITSSSNLAANLLLEKLGARNIQRTTDGLGASGMHVLRGVEDQKAFDRGLNNTTDAAALLTLLWKLGRGEVVSAGASKEMVGILERQRFNDGIPAGLPPGTVVAHKTGTITRIHHDAAIVYGPRPYVLVVLVRGIDNEQRSAALIADVSRIVDGLTGR